MDGAVIFDVGGVLLVPDVQIVAKAFRAAGLEVDEQFPDVAVRCEVGVSARVPAQPVGVEVDRTDSRGLGPSHVNSLAIADVESVGRVDFQSGNRRKEDPRIGLCHTDDGRIDDSCHRRRRPLAHLAQALTSQALLDCAVRVAYDRDRHLLGTERCEQFGTTRSWLVGARQKPVMTGVQNARVTEGEFWRRLEYRVTRELAGMEELNLRHLWCDGFIPETYEVQDMPPLISGRVWMNATSPWRFVLLLPEPVIDLASVHWVSLVPADDVTGWLSPDSAKKVLEIEPAAAVPD